MKTLRTANIRLTAAFAAALLLVVLVVSTARAADTYVVDPAHSSVSFRIRHLFSSVTGRFEKFEGKIVYDESDPKKSAASGSIDVATINTNVAKRDEHLKSPDFFDVAKYPKITFETTEVSDVSADGKSGKLVGNLTMHGVTKPVVLEATILGKGKDPQGKERIGLHATTKVNRKDYGLTWNKALETGGALVGDEVTIELDVEAAREG
jgi:polyisoprenoid-binding protein YceI